MKTKNTTYYESFNDLNGKTLKEGDFVVLDDIRYEVRRRFLWSSSNNNSAAFESLGMHSDKIKYSLTSKVYGYQALGGDWPESKWEDYEALTRLVLVLFAFLEGETEIEVKIEGKWVKINKNEFADDVTTVKLNSDYTAEVNNTTKVVTVGCQTFTFDSLRGLVSKFK
jgi:hypothetical protein